MRKGSAASSRRYAANEKKRPSPDISPLQCGIVAYGATRAAQAPDVPSLAELIPGFDLAVIQGLLARVGTPKPVIDRIASEVKAILEEPDIVRQFAAAGIEPASAGPDDYGRALQGERDRVAKVVQAAGIKMH